MSLESTLPADKQAPGSPAELDAVDARVLLDEIRQEMFGRGEPVTVGRFTLRKLLGRGAHGSVYLGEDSELQRSVAVKLLNVAAEPGARARLLREAQALAKLNHPNVLTIHEVGIEGDGVFIAMEYVEAGTLAQWCRKHPAGDRSRFVEVVDLAIGVARGISAAHDAGIVHRDVKPANILVGVDGRPRIGDFGLARTPYEARDLAERARAGGSALQSELTRTGDIVGTPAYMAPEQFEGRGDAASDQFSLCAAFWEAAYGERPFDDSTLATLIESLNGPPRSPPTERREIPGWWRELLTRGLSHDGAQRWPSVAELLAELERRRRGTPRRIAIGAGIGVVAAGVAGVQVWAEVRAERCSGAAEQLANVWNDARRAEARSAMLGTELPFAANAWEHSSAELDRYAAEWIQMHTEACAATTIRGEQSEELMDLRMACLHRANVRLAAVVDVVADADADVVKRATQLVGGLVDLGRCADAEALGADVEPPEPHEAQAVELARAQLAQVAAEETAGRSAEAERHLVEVQERLGEVSYGPVHTEAAWRHAHVLISLGKYEASEAALREALTRASQWRQWSVMQDAAAKLIFVLGNHQNRTAEALQFREIALGLARGDAAAEAEARGNTASVLLRQGKFAEAQAEFLRALALSEEAPVVDLDGVAIARSNLAVVLYEQGEYAKAEAEFRSVLAMREQMQGTTHPDVASARGNLAAILQARDKYAEAEAEIRRALASSEKTPGGHPEAAGWHNTLAEALRQQQKYEEAEAEYRTALARLEEALAPTHPDLATMRSNLANLLDERGHDAEAEALHRRALASLEEALGPEHADVARTRHNLAHALAEQGKLAQAEAQLRRALAVREKALGADHPALAETRGSLAAVLLDRGQAAEALSLAERAWEGRRQADTSPASRAKTEFLLARALLATKSSTAARRRARHLAERALAVFADAENQDAERAAEIRAWLDQRAR